MYYIEDHVEITDDDKRYGLYRSEPQNFDDTYIDTSKVGNIFKEFQREHGRCVSKVYIDTADGAKPIGWVFQKREEYEDSRPRYDDYNRRIKPKTFIREVWITLLDKHEVHVEREYHFLGT